MKTEEITSPVQSGQIVKKARSAKTNAPNDFDFMSVMNTVSISDMAAGSQSRNNSPDSVKQSSEGSKRASGTYFAGRREVKFSSSYKASIQDKTADATKTTGTDRTKDVKKPETSDRKTTSKAADKKDPSPVTKDDRRTTVEDDKGSKISNQDKDTKAAGPETEDDKVERPEATNDLISDILDTISKDLGVSTDDITDAMKTLGLSFANLNTPSNVAALFSKLTGTDNASILTSDQFTSFLSDMQDIFSAAEPDALDGLTPVTGDEADKLSNAFNLDDSHGLMTPDKALDVTVVNVETTETAGTNAADASVQDTDQIVSDDNSSNQTINGQITTDQIQSSSSNTEPDSSRSDLFGNSEKQQTLPDQVNANAVSAEGATNVSADAQVPDFVSTIQKYTSIDTDNLISQIAEKARQTLSAKVSSLEMELHPQSLGKIFLQVTEKSGDVTAHLYAQNEAVKHALENRLADLQDNLNRQGIKVNEVTISVEPHAFEENLEKNMTNQFGQNPGQEAQGFDDEKSHNGHSGNRSSIDLRNGAVPDDMSSEEVLEAQIMQDSGNTVSYRI
ncbi:MAG: hypothetical protein DUD27_05195 [Lachnospiraceae bacterium]|nr:MAG: hypothetical protein DUD27_05195 [Lachnospiraceae bacterium]